jgi:nucleoid-associated protein YgaU
LSSRSISVAAFALTCLTFAAAISSAQDVADAARQERARKQEAQKTTKHVYTNEDLKRDRILTPEDSAAVEARQKACATQKDCPASPAQNSQDALDANTKSQQPSLGEVARQLRKEKELQALKPKQTEPFHLSVGNPALASPILPARPALRPPAPPVILPPAKEIVRPESQPSMIRRDPFARVPARPRASLEGTSGVRPSAHSSAKAGMLAAPKISSRTPALAGIAASPAQPTRPTFVEAPAENISPADNSATPETSAPARKLGDVHLARPSVILKTRRANSPAAPAGISAAPKPAAPIASASHQPAAPMEFSPAKPSAPGKTIRPVPAPRVSAPVASSPTSVLSAPAVSPVAPSVLPPVRTIRVAPGDSLWKIARANLGRGSRWHELLSANPELSDPLRLRAGSELSLPAARSMASLTGTLGRGVRTIKVQRGDTLWSLAKAKLGRASSWPCLAAANPSLADASRIFAGQELILPVACSVPASSTRTVPARE